MDQSKEVYLGYKQCGGQQEKYVFDKWVLVTFAYVIWVAVETGVVALWHHTVNWWLNIYKLIADITSPTLYNFLGKIICEG